jgi:hypothetical protein
MRFTDHYSEKIGADGNSSQHSREFGVLLLG